MKHAMISDWDEYGQNEIDYRSFINKILNCLISHCSIWSWIQKKIEWDNQTLNLKVTENNLRHWIISNYHIICGLFVEEAPTLKFLFVLVLCRISLDNEIFKLIFESSNFSLMYSWSSSVISMLIVI